MNCYDESSLDNCDDDIVDDDASTTKGIIEDAINELCNEEDMDAFFASGVHGGSKVGIDAKHLSKVWRISYDQMHH